MSIASVREGVAVIDELLDVFEKTLTVDTLDLAAGYLEEIKESEPDPSSGLRALFVADDETLKETCESVNAAADGHDELLQRLARLREWLISAEIDYHLREIRALSTSPRK